MKNLLLAFCATTLSLVVFPGCSSDERAKESPNERKEIVMGPQCRSAAENLNSFSVRLIRDIAQFCDNYPSEYSPNVVVSPLSATILYSLLANGVEEKAQVGIKEYFGNCSLDEMNSYATTLIDELPKVDNQSTMNLIQALWIDQQRQLTIDYTSLATGLYQSDISYRDIKNHAPALVVEINQWASEKTKGLINEVVKIIPPETPGLLANATYFKSAWSDEIFNKENTRRGAFNSPDGIHQVDMMHSNVADGFYLQTEKFTAVKLDLGNRAFSMTLMLPAEGMTYQDATSQLDEEQYLYIMSRLNPRQVQISMPKFDMHAFYPMRDALAETALSPLWEKGSMTMFEDAPEVALKVDHIVSFSVNEDGATAAAVTITGMLTGTNHLPVANVDFNRPFFFFVTEQSTGACVMAGRVVNL